MRSSRKTLSTKQLRLAPHRLPQPLADVGEPVLVGDHGRDVPQVEPLAREARDQRARPLVGEHAPRLRLEHRGLAQPARLGEVEQLVVGDAAPQEEGQARRELEVADGVALPRRDPGRVALDPQHELGAREQPPQGHLDAGVEAALAPTLVEEPEEDIEIGRGDGAPVGPAREGRHDAARARGLLGLGRAAGGTAHEDAPAARRLLRRGRAADRGRGAVADRAVAVSRCRGVANHRDPAVSRCRGVANRGEPAVSRRRGAANRRGGTVPRCRRVTAGRKPAPDRERPGDRDAAQVRLHPGVAAGDAGVRPEVGLAQRLGIGRRLPHERHPQLARPRPDRQAELPVAVDVPLPVAPPAVLVAVARPVGRRPASGEGPHQLAVQAHLHRVRHLEDGEVVAGVAGERDAEVVLRVLRERVPERAAAAGAERHARHPVVLRQVAREAEHLGGGRGGGASDRHPGDLPRRREVALQQGRRNPEHPRDVVEAVARAVGRQQLRDVDIQVEEVAHGVVILGPVQPVERLGAAGVGVGRGVPVQLGLQPADEPVVARRVRPRSRRRRHGPGPQLPDHRLPHRGRRRHRRHVVLVEGQPCRPHAAVVAGHAVAVQQLPLPAGGRAGLLPCLRGRGRPGAGRPADGEGEHSARERGKVSRCRHVVCTRRSIRTMGNGVNRRPAAQAGTSRGRAAMVESPGNRGGERDRWRSPGSRPTLHAWGAFPAFETSACR